MLQKYHTVGLALPRKKFMVSKHDSEYSSGAFVYTRKQGMGLSGESEAQSRHGLSDSPLLLRPTVIFCFLNINQRSTL